MTKEENKLLCDKYPFLKVHDWNGKFIGYDYTWQDSIPEGWRKVMCPQIWDELKEVLVYANYLNEFTFCDIKEKFGALRFGYSGLADKYMKRFEAWEDKYQNMSRQCCIDCGEKVEYMQLSWITYVCKECAIKRWREQRARGLNCYFVKISDLDEYLKAKKEDKSKYWIGFTEMGKEYYVNKNN